VPLDLDGDVRASHRASHDEEQDGKAEQRHCGNTT
jgi:hypothetical protein